MKRRAWLLIPVAIVMLVAMRQTPEPDAAAKTREVARLAPVVALVDEIGLRWYRDENGCRSIEYQEGAFTNDNVGTTCVVVDPLWLAFTAPAEAAFERVRRSLAATGLAVFSVYVVDAYEPAAGGNNRQVVFDLVERAVGRWAYVHEPGHEPLPDRPNGTTDIDADWYFMAWDPSEQ